MTHLSLPISSFVFPVTFALVHPGHSCTITFKWAYLNQCTLFSNTALLRHDIALRVAYLENTRESVEHYFESNVIEG